MATSAPSSSNTETVRMQLPSGETINGVVPAGLSDDEVKSYVRMKRPDLFGAPAPAATQSGTGAPPNNAVTQAIHNQAVAPMAGVPGGSSNPVAAGPGYTAAVGGPVGAAAAYAGSSLALPFLGAAAAKYPTATRMIASEGVTQARKIPYVGKFIPPGAEILPWLIGGGSSERGPVSEPDATRGNPPYAGEDLGPVGAPKYRDMTGNRNFPPYAGEDLGSPETPPLGAHENPAADLPGPFAQTQAPKPANTPYAWQLTPMGRVRNPGDMLEDRATQQEMQWNLEQNQAQVERESAREFAARNSAATPKSALQNQFKQQNPQTEDLTPQWTKELERIKARKKTQ